MALKNRFERIGRGGGARPLGFSPLGEGEADSPRFLQVAPGRIERDPSQPRQELGELEGLRASIKEHGILQPLIVTALDDQRYKLVAGERRLTAALQLGLGEVPVLVRGVEEQQRLVLQIVENLHRKDLSPLEEAEGLRRLLDESGLNQRDAAAQLGKTPTYINELLRVLQLPGDVLAAVRTSEQPISKSLLLEITKQPDEAQQRKLWQRASSGAGLTVKQARDSKRAGRPASAAHTDGSRRATNAGTTAQPGEPPEWSFRSKVGLVSVRFDHGATGDKESICQALEEALQSVKGGRPARRS